MATETSIQTADQEQLAQAKTIVNTMLQQPGDKTAMRVGWAELFNLFQSIHQNLVMQLIANGLRSQVITHLTNIDTNVDELFIRNVLSRLLNAITKRNPAQAGEAVADYFEWVRQVAAFALKSPN